MNEFSTYERLIQQKNTGKLLSRKVGLIFLYLSWIGICLWIMGYLGIYASILVFIPISTVILVVLTWKYVRVEYEYIIVGGTFQVTKIYGKRKRKAMLEIDLKQALLIAPYHEENLAKAERLSPEETVMAISSSASEEIWMIVTEEEKDKRVLFFFEADEAAVRILRRTNPHATLRT